MAEAIPVIADYQPSEAIWTALVVSAMDAIIVIDEQQHIVLFNPAAEKMFRCPVEKVLGQRLDRFIPERFRAAHFEHVRQFGEGRPTNRRMGSDYYLPALRADGEEFPIELSISVSTTGGKKLYTAIVRDVTERLRTEEALRQSEAEFRLAFEDAQDAIFWANPETGLLVNCNKAAEELLERTREEIVGQHQTILHPPQNTEAYARMFHEHVEKKHIDEEATIVTKSGKTKVVQIRAAVTLIGDKPIIQGIFHDITQRKLAEEQLRASLHEKEVLLREVHHRVKNNLAIIDSFLSLQANKCQDPVAAEGLRDCQNRLRSMAFIHDRLYQVDDLAFIDFGGYITSLCHHLFQSYGVDPRRIHLRLDLGEFFLSLEVAMPLGLLLNELLANIIKYAFPEGRGGEVSVQLQTLGEGLAHLVVSDNGVGLPPDVNVQRPQSVGLRLVQILARQIGGTLEFHRNGGTTVRLAFPSALSGAKHVAEQKLENKSLDRRG